MKQEKYMEMLDFITSNYRYLNPLMPLYANCLELLLFKEQSGITETNLDKLLEIYYNKFKR